VRLVVDCVAKTFGGKKVIDGLSASFSSGQVTALVGPSGSGKSTLLAMMSGWAKVERGRIFLELANGISRAPVPGDFAWIAQDNSALPGRSVLDNVMMGALSSGTPSREARARAIAALDSVSMEGRRGSPLNTLSGGERQRVCFARAIAAGRNFILADEPTSSLDEANTLQLTEVLRALRTTTTIIVATHDPLMMSAAEHVVEMRHS
jgi:putative ABC transport system ATP-binding protein